SAFELVAIADVRFVVTCTSDGAPPEDVSGSGETGGFGYTIEDLDSGHGETTDGTLKSEPSAERQGVLTVVGPSSRCAPAHRLVQEAIVYENLRIRNTGVEEEPTMPIAGTWRYVHPE
ncbi:MAG: hypothetical protein ACRD1T_08080, partial [Acidimicrobiia bacterium]